MKKGGGAEATMALYPLICLIITPEKVGLNITGFVPGSALTYVDLSL